MPIDEEVIQRYRPEPPTEVEAEWMEKIDAVEYGIYLRQDEPI